MTPRSECERGSSSQPPWLTAALLARCMPHCPKDRLDSYAAGLGLAMDEIEAHPGPERAMFLAQLAHESGELRWFEEIADGSLYEGRKDLGNTEPGDGIRYKGRGPIQLTGRANYRAAGEALGLDLERDPYLAARPEVGFRIAAWYWRSRGCSKPARDGNFELVTRKINGGVNHYEQRLAHYWRILAVLKDP